VVGDHSRPRSASVLFGAGKTALNIDLVQVDADYQMKEQPREVLLYVADLKRDGLIKVGSTKNLGRRLTELRRHFGPDVEIFQSAPIPNGLGTPKSWEVRLKAKILLPRYREQLDKLDELEKAHDVDQERFGLMWGFNLDLISPESAVGIGLQS
jgi:hypothetical protein